MAFLTENKLAKVQDVPVALPTTEIMEGDWVIVASIKLVSPQRLTYRFMNLQMLESSVSTSLISAANKVSANLDLAFIGLYLNYTSGHPGLAPALDVLKINGVGSVQKTSAVIVAEAPGVYSFIAANNMKASSSSSVPVTTSIDFKLCATGQIRLELDKS